MYLSSINLLTVILFLSSCKTQVPTNSGGSSIIDSTWIKTDQEWAEILSPEAYYVMREKGTERAFTGDLWDNEEVGIYVCHACQQPLFESKTKFKSGTGWPSFFQPINQNMVSIEIDTSFGMVRAEVLCSRCGGHLGHAFNDGPPPTGMRYCLNSISLDFEEKEPNQ